MPIRTLFLHPGRLQSTKNQSIVIMNTFGFDRASRTLPFLARLSPASVLIVGALLCAALSAPVVAQQDPSLTRDPLVNGQEPEDTTAIPVPPDTHATRQAPLELMLEAARDPASVIGKTLVLHDGVNEVIVGPVKDLRKRLQDEELYLIVDATEYFNAPADYAVALSDVGRMEGTKLVIPEAPGMHLRGLDYYPDDYADVEGQAL